MKVHFELMKCINDQLTRLFTRAKHASRSAAEASMIYLSKLKDFCQQNIPEKILYTCK